MENYQTRIEILSCRGTQATLLQDGAVQVCKEYDQRVSRLDRAPDGTEFDGTRTEAMGIQDIRETMLVSWMQRDRADRDRSCSLIVGGWQDREIKPTAFVSKTQ